MMYGYVSVCIGNPALACFNFVLIHLILAMKAGKFPKTE